MAGQGYAFLPATAERLWNEIRHDARVRNGRARRVYQSGVVGGLREKLRPGRVDPRRPPRVGR